MQELRPAIPPQLNSRQVLQRLQPLYRTYENARAFPLEFICAAEHIDGAESDSVVERRSPMDKEGEPPSTCRAKSFRIGRNSRGNWVVQDQSGLCGGMFVNRTEAVKFAMFENGNRPQAVIMVPGILELDMSGRRADSTPSSQGRLVRAA
jgi:hypothetical protein